MMRRARPEQALQKAVVGHLQWRARPDVWFCAIPNGDARSPIEGAIFKGLGVVAGAPDLLIVRDGRASFLELKAQGGRLSEAQRECHERLRRAGAVVATATGLDAALDQLEDWQLLRPGHYRPASLTGRPAEIASEIAAAPDRQTAEQLIAVHDDAIAALSPAVREQLLATLHDTLQELEFRHPCESATAALPPDPEKEMT